MIVYAITNRVNGKRYIGMTEGSLARRWWFHRKAAREGAKTALHAAIRKYGEDSFSIAPIAYAMPGADRGALQTLERLLIAQEGVMTPDGYNLTPGGDGWPKGKPSPMRGVPMSPEHRAAFDASKTPEWRARHAEVLRERNAVMNQTEEHKAKLKDAWARSSGRREAQAARVREINLGAVRSDEYKRNHSARMKQWWAERRASNG